MSGEWGDDAELKHETVGVQMRRTGGMVLQVFHPPPRRPDPHWNPSWGGGFHEAPTILKSMCIVQ